MRHYKHIVTITSMRSGKVVKTIEYKEWENGKALAYVAEHNAKPFRSTYADVETIAVGSDPIADRAQEMVARCIKRDWSRFRP